MRFWLKKNKCTGCFACANICPKKAITMKADQCGFFYPEITSLCIDCGLCKKVCEARGKIVFNDSRPTVFAGWSNNPSIRFESTSGGIFTELAKKVLSRKGKIYGAAYDKNNMVEHVSIDSFGNLESLRQSKYIQSSICDTFKAAKQDLINNRDVLFCGTPCQIAGLYAFLGKHYDKLTTLDFVCRGVNSPKAFKAWLDEIETKKQKRITKVWFKYKENGWKESPKCTRVDYKDGTYDVFYKEKNLFMSAYLGPNLFIRPSCADCDFKGFPRLADISVGDFWRVDCSLDDDKGTSLIMVNTENGYNLLKEIESSVSLYKQEFDAIFGGNVCIDNSVVISSNSTRFLKSLDKMSFSEAYKKYTKKSLANKLKQKITILVKKGKQHVSK